MLERVAHLLAAFDRHVDNVGRVHRARDRMKTAILSLIAGALVVIGEAVGLAIVAADGPPPLIQFWGPISAVGVGLVAFATMKATLTSHKEYTSSVLASKASKDELVALSLRLEDLHADVREIRAGVQSILQRRA